MTNSQELLADVLLISVESDPCNERGDLNEDLGELIASLRALGLLERVRLYSMATGCYLIASGHRRVAAARALGWSTIPAIVSTSPEDHVEQTISRITSNLCRKDIDPISFAHSIQILLAQYSVSVPQVGAWLGKSPTSVSNYLRLLELPEEVQDALQANALSVGHALQLLRIKEPELDWFGNTIATVDECRVRCARASIEENLSIRALEVRIKNLLDNSRAIHAWLAKQDASSRIDMNTPTMPQTFIHDVSMGISTLVRDEKRLQSQRAVAKEAIQAAMDFDESQGPSLDHLRLAVLMLADVIYLYHDTNPFGLPDHGSLNRSIERAADARTVLNLLGRLVTAAVLNDLNSHGTDLIGNGRSKWAKSHFQLTPTINRALQEANLRDE